MDNRPIGFWIRVSVALTVVRELMRQLPMKKSSILEIRHGRPMVPVLLSKSVNIPWQLVNFLLTKDVKMIVIACNIL